MSSNEILNDLSRCKKNYPIFTDVDITVVDPDGNLLINSFAPCVRLPFQMNYRYITYPKYRLPCRFTLNNTELGFTPSVDRLEELYHIILHRYLYVKIQLLEDRDFVITIIKLLRQLNDMLAQIKNIDCNTTDYLQDVTNYSNRSLVVSTIRSSMITRNSNIKNLCLCIQILNTVIVQVYLLHGNSILFCNGSQKLLTMRETDELWSEYNDTNNTMCIELFSHSSDEIEMIEHNELMQYASDINCILGLRGSYDVSLHSKLLLRTFKHPLLLSQKPILSTCHKISINQLIEWEKHAYDACIVLFNHTSPNAQRFNKFNDRMITKLLLYNNRTSAKNFYSLIYWVLSTSTGLDNMMAKLISDYGLYRIHIGRNVISYTLKFNIKFPTILSVWYAIDLSSDVWDNKAKLCELDMIYSCGFEYLTLLEHYFEKYCNTSFPNSSELYRRITLYKSIRTYRNHLVNNNKKGNSKNSIFKLCFESIKIGRTIFPINHIDEWAKSARAIYQMLNSTYKNYTFIDTPNNVNDELPYAPVYMTTDVNDFTICSTTLTSVTSDPTIRLLCAKYCMYVVSSRRYPTKRQYASYLFRTTFMCNSFSRFVYPTTLSNLITVLFHRYHDYRQLFKAKEFAIKFKKIRKSAKTSCRQMNQQLFLL